jgi:hypothetical protein
MPAFTTAVVPGHGAERRLAEIQVAGGSWHWHGAAATRSGRSRRWH